MPQSQSHSAPNTIGKAAPDAFSVKDGNLSDVATMQPTAEKYYAILNSIDDAFALCKLIRDESGNAIDFRYLEFNISFEKQRQLSKEHVLGRTALEIHPDLESWWINIYQNAVDEQQLFHGERFFSNCWFEIKVFPFKDDCFGVIFKDITEQKGAGQILSGQKHAFQAAMSGQSLAASLQPLINAIIAQTNGEARAAFYIVPPDKQGLHLIAGMSEEYARDVNGFKVGPELIACGLAMHSGEPLITSDVEAEPLWQPFLSLARKHNYRGCWSFPVQISGGPVLGTFAMYFEQPRKPNQRELELAGILTHTAAIIISRHKELVEATNVEEALQGSEEKYRAIFNSINEGFSLLEILFDDDGNACDIIVRDANPAQNKVDGIQAMIGKRVREILPDIEEKWIARYANIARSGKPEQFQDWSEANQRWYDVNASRVGGDGSNLVAIVYNDITERKKAEEALRESEQKLREFNNILEQQVKERTAELQENNKLLESIYNTTHVGMSVFKPVYNKQNQITDFEIVIVNKRIEDSSGRKDLPGKLYSEEFPGIKKMGLLDAMIKAMETGETIQMEYFYEYEGINRWYSTMYTRNGNMLVCSNMDMTEQKQAEERNRELDRRQKELEERQQQEIFRTVLDTQEVERKRIAESLHNSLGQILYAVKLSLGTVSKASMTENDKECMKNADKLLNDAITESRRLSHELMPVILEDFGLKTAVEDICRKLSGNIQFKCRFKGSIKKLDKYVEVAIYRLVQELVINVIKHSEASSSLVAVEVYTDRIQVLVQDNGKGFNILKDKKGGIGLKTIRNNVNLLNGKITITSKAGMGTIINIDIPFKSK